MSILQGTTPSLKIKIKKVDFLVGDVVKLEFGIFHDGRQYLKGLGDVIIDSEENSFTYVFSEEETLAMNPKKKMSHQHRFMFADGSITGTKEKTITIEDLRSKEVMSE